MKRSAAALAIILMTTLGGCAAPAAPDPPDASNRSQLDLVLEQLGAYPASAPLSDDEVATAVRAVNDRNWGAVSTDYPDAVRPVVELVRLVDQVEAAGELAACIESAGIPITDDEDGVTWQPATEPESLVWFTCHAQLPQRPVAPLTDAQLGYLYDYLTLFVVPCFEARGSEIDEPPSRTAFIDEWPVQGWFPIPNHAEPDSAEHAATFEACPYLQLR